MKSNNSMGQKVNGNDDKTSSVLIHLTPLLFSIWRCKIGERAWKKRNENGNDAIECQWKYQIAA